MEDTRDNALAIPDPVSTESGSIEFVEAQVHWAPAQVVWQRLQDLHHRALGEEGPFESAVATQLGPEDAFSAYSHSTLLLMAQLGLATDAGQDAMLHSLGDFALLSGSLDGLDGLFLTAAWASDQAGALDYAAGVLSMLGLPDVPGGGAATTALFDTSTSSLAFANSGPMTSVLGFDDTHGAHAVQADQLRESLSILFTGEGMPTVATGEEALFLDAHVSGSAAKGAEIGAKIGAGYGAIAGVATSIATGAPGWITPMTAWFGAVGAVHGGALGAVYGVVTKDEAHPAGEKPADGKPADGKPTDGKPTDGKPTDGKPTDGKPTDGKPTSSSGVPVGSLPDAQPPESRGVPVGSLPDAPRPRPTVDPGKVSGCPPYDDSSGGGGGGRRGPLDSFVPVGDGLDSFVSVGDDGRVMLHDLPSIDQNGHLDPGFIPMEAFAIDALAAPDLADADARRSLLNRIQTANREVMQSIPEDGTSDERWVEELASEARDAAEESPEAGLSRVRDMCRAVDRATQYLRELGG